MSIKALVNANSIYTVLFPANTKGGLDAANISKKTERTKLSANFLSSTMKNVTKYPVPDVTLIFIKKSFIKREKSGINVTMGSGYFVSVTKCPDPIVTRRLALHKNRSGIYGGGFGDKWLSRKLENNASGITTQNCYLPYK